MYNGMLRVKKSMSDFCRGPHQCLGQERVGGKKVHTWKAASKKGDVGLWTPLHVALKET